MKVVILAPTPPPAGGIAGWTMRMKSVKLKNGWSVEVVDEKVIGTREVFGNKNKRNILIEIKRCLKIWRNLLECLEDTEVKVVHSCIPTTTTAMLREYVCAILSKIKKKKFIVHYRCTIPNMVKSKIGLFMFKLLTNKSDLVMVLNGMSEEFIKKYSETPVSVVPNFIEENAISNETLKNISKEVKRILYVGGVIESKGCYDIIKVAERFDEIEFVLVGKYEEGIREIINSDNVTLLGEKNIDDVKCELDKADIFMFVTYFPGEGFSNALVEAMANGIPCIVSDWAANRDMIEDKGGIVVPHKNIDMMVRAVDIMVNDYEMRKGQSKWNIKKVREKYTDKIVTDMYVDIYEKVLKDG